MLTLESTNTLFSMEDSSINKVFLTQIINHYMALSKREKIYFSLCSINIVDEAIEESVIGKLFFHDLSASTRDIDLVFQTSDTAFVMILPEMLSDDSEVIVNRLKSKLASHHETAQILFSYNFYEYNNDEISAEKLLEQMNDAQYVKFESAE